LELRALKKIQRISALTFVLLFALFVAASYRMNTCGYDCGMFSVTSGGATVIYYLMSLGLGIISFAILVGVSVYIFIKPTFKG
jgi:hypothetical protein